MMLPVKAQPEFIQHYSRYFKEIVGKNNLNQFRSYLTGLYTNEESICLTRIAELNSKYTSYEQLQYFVSDSKVDWKSLNDRRVQILESNPKTSSQTEHGIANIDDTQSHHEGKTIAANGKFFDHCQHRYNLSQNILSSHFVNGNTDWPIKAEFYWKKEQCDNKRLFKTKIQMACEQVEYANQKNIKIKTWNFDSWFTCKELSDKIESYGQDWVGGLKSNRIVVDSENQKIPVKQLAQTIDSKDFKYAGKVHGKGCYYWAKTMYVVSLKKRCKLVFIKNKLEDEIVTILSSSHTTWQGDKIIKTYAKRWIIETFYRTSKQVFKLEDCQLRKESGVEGHLAMVLLAYSILQLVRVSKRFDKIYRLGKRVGSFAKAVVLRSFIRYVRQMTALKYTSEAIFRFSLE